MWMRWQLWPKFGPEETVLMCPLAWNMPGDPGSPASVWSCCELPWPVSAFRNGSSKASENKGTKSCPAEMTKGDNGGPVLPCGMREVTGWSWCLSSPLVEWLEAVFASYGIIKYTLDETEEGNWGLWLQYSGKEAGVAGPAEGYMQSGLRTLSDLHDFSCGKRVGMGTAISKCCLSHHTYKVGLL